MRKCPKTGKEVHRSRGKAAAHLRNLRGRSRDHYPAGQVYVCRLCGGWHVGRRTLREMKRNKYANAGLAAVLGKGEGNG